MTVWLRASAPTLALMLLATSCSSGPWLTDYAKEVELLVTTMGSDLDAIDADLDSSEPSVEVIGAYGRNRIEIRTTFLAAFEELAEPPREAADIHAAALEAIRNLVAAEQAVFEQASVITDLEEIGRLWETPAGQAARIADEQAIAICQAAEAAINSTQDRQQFVGMPWVPTELQEVVSVAFGCTAEDR